MQSKHKSKIVIQNKTRQQAEKTTKEQLERKQTNNKKARTRN